MTIVLVVDDLDRLDPASRTLLLYLVTHHQISIVLLATATVATWAVHLPYPLTLRKIPPLTPAEALQVLAARQPPPTAPRVAATLARQLSGNTACILQTALKLSDAQLAGSSLLPNPLPLVPALEAVHGPTLDVLDDHDRRTLLVAAVCVVDRTDLLLAAAGRTLDEVLDGPVADLVHLAGGRFTIVEPGVRVLVHGRASVAERTAAHLALATAHHAAGLTDTGTWHSALGSLAGDPDLGPALVDIAERLLTSGDVVHAHEVAREAASQLTDVEATRAQLVAGIAALRAGHVRDADEWLQQVMRSPDPALTSRALAPYVRAVTLHTGRVPDDDVAQHVDRVLDTGDDAQRRSVVEALSTTARLHAERGHFDGSVRYLRTARELLASLDDESTTTTPTALGALQTTHLRELVNLDAAWCTLLGAEPGEARTVALVSPDAHPDHQSSARAHRALQHVLEGDLETARSSLASAVVTHAPLHDDGTWRSAPGTAVSPLAEALLRAARVLVELAAADLRAASDELDRASFYVPVDLPLAGIAIAAARRLDVFRLDEAGDLSLALAATTPAPLSDAVRRESLVDRVLLAERDGVRREASKELELLAGTSPAPWDAVLPGVRLPGQAGTDHPSCTMAATAFRRARDDLAGARSALRTGATSALHERLTLAAELFGTCGAHAWQAAALRASETAATPLPLPVATHRAEPSMDHVPHGPAAPDGLEPGGGPPGQWGGALTRRELDVALLVVQGASNRDVASTLHVSVRTVEVHLGRVFRKLGARSRVELTVLAHRGTRRISARTS